MEHVVDPDISYERCSACSGIFLDAGELNALVTGMPGDIEFCSIGSDSHADRFPSRSCPKCPKSEMKKEVLLNHTEIIFDYCEECRGWFLDPQELEQTNATLSELRSGDAEYRATHRDRLVTLVKIPVFVAGAVGPMGQSSSTMVEWDRVDAFYSQPLGAGLRVSPETWAGKLWRLLGVQDVMTGDSDFDREFLVKAKDPKAAVGALGRRAREAIVGFNESSLSKLGKKRKFEALDDRVVFCFTDWGGEGRRPTESEKQQLFDALAETARAIDGGE